MLKRGVFKTLFQSVDALVTGKGRIDDELFDEAAVEKEAREFPGLHGLQHSARRAFG